MPRGFKQMRISEFGLQNINSDIIPHSARRAVALAQRAISIPQLM
jgi:hypothetical protein